DTAAGVLASLGLSRADCRAGGAPWATGARRAGKKDGRGRHGNSGTLGIGGSTMPVLDTPRRRVRWTTTTIVALSLTAASGMLAAPNAPLRLVSTAWPPFTNAPKQPRLALDLVEAALGRIGVTSKTVIVSAPQYTSSLLSGLFDGSAAAWKDPDRERDLVLSQPYLENRLVLIGRRGSDVTAKALTDLKGKKVAIVDGYSYGQTSDPAGPQWIRSRGEEDSLSQLLKGVVDYTLMDELVINY